ncbi:MAG TPA: HEAT repeat domain-containing protein [bacterium]|nr:HEAT repeat domain-containing protein [bacterium]HNS48752.1 HEAT repeat domain-containing protein [bacterium]
MDKTRNRLIGGCLLLAMLLWFGSRLSAADPDPAETARVKAVFALLRTALAQHDSKGVYEQLGQERNLAQSLENYQEMIQIRRLRGGWIRPDLEYDPERLEVEFLPDEDGRGRARVWKLNGDGKRAGSEEFAREGKNWKWLPASGYLWFPEPSGELEEIERRRQAMEAGLASPNPFMRFQTAVNLLEHKQSKTRALQVLQNLLKEPDPRFRLRVAEAVLGAGDKNAVPVLIDLLAISDTYARAKFLLEKSTGQNFGALTGITTKAEVTKFLNDWKAWWNQNKGSFQLPAAP